jgi:HlyD family secretion protein
MKLPEHSFNDLEFQQMNKRLQYGATMNKHLIMVPLFLLLLFFLFNGCNKKKNNHPAFNELHTVEKVDIRDIISQTGTVEPIIKVEIKSEASGKITQLRVKEGQKVTKGDTILIIDPVRLLTQKDKLELAIKKSDLDYLQADRDFKNSIELAKSGSVSEKKVQDLDIARQKAEIELRQQKLEMKDIREQLGKTVITAPMSGVITALLVEEGEIAVSATSGFQGGTSIGTIADISKLEVVTTIGEVDYIHLSANQPVAIRPEAIEGTQTKGSISFLSLSAKKDANSELSKFEVRATIDSLIPGIAPGINVNVDFIIKEKLQVLGIPSHFVTKKGKDSFVTIAQKGDNDKLQMIPRKIITGITDYKNIEIIDGLKAGEKLIFKPEISDRSQMGKGSSRGRGR